MHRPRLLLALAASVALALTGCASASAPSSSPTSEASATTTASPTPTPEPAENHELIVGVEDVTFVHGDESESATYADGLAMVAFLTDALGDPEVSAVEPDPDSDYAWAGGVTKYDWDGVLITLRGTDPEPAGPARLIITSPEVDDVAVHADGSITIGSTRDDAIAAGAVDPYGSDTAAQYLALNAVEVPGTESLAHPGSVGVDFIMLTVEGDVITQISAVGNDYSDL